MKLARGLAYVILLVYWAIALWGLDRFPPLHNDETTLLAPGYKLFTQGVYGLDMYTGFFGSEKHYLEVMPLMPLLQGASARWLGVGVWQMRFVPVASGLLTLALVWAVGRCLAGPRAALLSLGLLLIWQWMPSGDVFLGSGVPMLDMARVARYDILVAPLGLGAFWWWLRVGRTRRLRDEALSGLLGGLAGIANLYGVLWVIVLGGMRMLDQLWVNPADRPATLKHLTVFLLSASLPFVLWSPMMVLNWNDFLGQFSKHAYDGRFGFTQPMFYLNNLVNEIHRYHLGARDPATYGRMGFWLVAVGMPLGLAGLAWQVWRRRDRTALWLLGPAVLLPIGLAVLVNKKTPYYLLLIVPVWALVLGWATSNLWDKRKPTWRTILLIGFALAAVQSSNGVASLASQISARPDSPARFWAELRALVPDSDKRLYGPHEYWFAFYDREYRGFALAFQWAAPYYGYDLTFDEALTKIAPQVVLVNPYFERVLAVDDPANPATFWAFMRRHRACLLGELRDYAGEPVKVYELDW